MSDSYSHYTVLHELTDERKQLLKRLAPHLIPASGGDPKRAEHDKQKSKHRKEIRKKLRANGEQIIARVLLYIEEEE
jgi:hypothetical protein